MDDADLFDGGYTRQAVLDPKGTQYADLASRIAWGKVVARHPAEGTMDVALSQGSTLTHVPVLSPWLSTTAGEVYDPAHDLTAPNQTPEGIWDIPLPSGGTDVWAVVAFIQSNGQTRTPNAPVILGFLPVSDGQMTFQTAGLAVWRHESGVYHVTFPTVGQHDEWHWPDGSALVIGTDTTAATMTDENAAWAPPTTSTPAAVTYQHASGASLTIDPQGNITVNAASGATLTFNGGTAGIARVGDSVSVDLSTGAGTITTGSATVKSG